MVSKLSTLRLVGDLDDPNSFEGLMEMSAEHLAETSYQKKVVEIESLWPYKIIISPSEESEGFDIVATASDFIGEVGPCLKYRSHRALAVLNSVEDHTRSQIARNLLRIQDWIEGPLFEENVCGYDLISFYIKQGMAPEGALFNCDELKSNLVSYRLECAKGNGEISSVKRASLPMVTLIHCPGAALIYWQEILTRCEVQQIDPKIQVFTHDIVAQAEQEKPLETSWQVNEMFGLDEAVMPLLMTLEQVPFLATVSSCSGHLMTAHLGIGENAEPDQYFVEDGHLIFEHNNSDQAQTFLQALEDLIKRFSNQVKIDFKKNDSKCQLDFRYEGTPSSEPLTIPSMKPVFVIDRGLGEDKSEAFSAFYAELAVLGRAYIDNFSTDRATELEKDLKTAMEGVGLKKVIQDRTHMAII